MNTAVQAIAVIGAGIVDICRARWLMGFRPVLPESLPVIGRSRRQVAVA